MSRSVLVLSLPRSGSSCVAGILDRLGVSMGESHLSKPNAANPIGYYQDDRWTRLNADVGGWGYSTKTVESITAEQKAAYRRLITECEKKPIWGVKHPRLCFVSQFIWPLLVDMRMIAIHRPFADVVQSLVRYSEINAGGSQILSRGEAEGIITRWKNAYEQRMAEYPTEIYHIDYYDLLQKPKDQVSKLASFCFEGYGGLRPDKIQMDNATGFVQDGLRHF